jgi:hypothetical protein
MFSRCRMLTRLERDTTSSFLFLVLGLWIRVNRTFHTKHLLSISNSSLTSSRAAALIGYRSTSADAGEHTGERREESYVRGAGSKRLVAILEQCLRSYGETVTLAVPLMPVASKMVADMV